MKTFFGNFFLIVSFTLLFVNCRNKEIADKINTLVPIKSDTLPIGENGIKEGFLVEDLLDRWVVRVGSEVGKNAVERTPYFLKLNGIALPFLASEIDTNETNRMHEIAQSLQPVSCTTSSVTGLRIIYGSNSNNQLQLYYQPLLFCFVRLSPGGNSQKNATYRLDVEGLYYRYEVDDDAGQFVEATEADMNEDIARYRNETTGLGILRDGASTFDYFRDTSSYDGDVRSTLFTFQQIKDIYRSADCSGFVRFWNAPGKILKYNPPHFIRHILLLSSDHVTETNGEINHDGNHFSDLCHLCPVSCNGEKFSFALSH